MTIPPMEGRDSLMGSNPSPLFLEEFHALVPCIPVFFGESRWDPYFFQLLLDFHELLQVQVLELNLLLLCHGCLRCNPLLVLGK